MTNPIPLKPNDRLHQTNATSPHLWRVLLVDCLWDFRKNAFMEGRQMNKSVQFARLSPRQLTSILLVQLPEILRRHEHHILIPRLYPRMHMTIQYVDRNIDCHLGKAAVAGSREHGPEFPRLFLQSLGRRGSSGN